MCGVGVIKPAPYLPEKGARVESPLRNGKFKASQPVQNLIRVSAQMVSIKIILITRDYKILTTAPQSNSAKCHSELTFSPERSRRGSEESHVNTRRYAERSWKISTQQIVVLVKSRPS